MHQIIHLLFIPVRHSIILLHMSLKLQKETISRQMSESMQIKDVLSVMFLGLCCTHQYQVQPSSTVLCTELPRCAKQRCQA